MLGGERLNLRCKSEPQKSAQGKDVIGVTVVIGKMFLNIEIRLVMAEGINHVECLAVIGADNLGGEWCPDVSHMGQDIDATTIAKELRVGKGIGGVTCDWKTHTIG